MGDDTMKTVTFECETITPMFLAGADGRTPELRPPSIKGLMRFWWRAMNGHLSDLKKEEGKIFGASDEGIGRSKFRIRVKEQPPRGNIVKNLGEEIPYEERTSKKGVSYLLYSVLMLNKRPYIKSNTPFSISISSSDPQPFQEAVHSFAFLTFFGALGTRSRRGAGSFRVKNVIYNQENYNELFDTSGVRTKEQLKDHMDSKLRPLITHTRNTSYSILSGSKIYIFDSKSNWKDALETIGKPFLDFRGDNENHISDTPNFGFPILHRRNFKTLMGAGPESFRKNHRGNVIDFMERRASPLIFKIIKTDENNYFPVIIWLRGDLIPPDYKIMNKKGGNIKQPDEGIVRTFLNGLPAKLEAIL
jgi:CRISPR-associated protein Cmr1